MKDSQKEEIRQRLVRDPLRGWLNSLERRDVIIGDALSGFGVSGNA